MTEAHKRAISRGLKEMRRRRNLSIGMKKSWERRRKLAGDNPDVKPNSTLAVNAADEPSLDSLYQATKMLVDFDQLRTAVANEFSVDELIGGLIEYTGGGTSVQTNLRKFLVTQIETSLYE
jgi:hypothetical protein